MHVPSRRPPLSVMPCARLSLCPPPKQVQHARPATPSHRAAVAPTFLDFIAKQAHALARAHARAHAHAHACTCSRLRSHHRSGPPPPLRPEPTLALSRPTPIPLHRSLHPCCLPSPQLPPHHPPCAYPRREPLHPPNARGIHTCTHTPMPPCMHMHTWPPALSTQWAAGLEAVDAAPGDRGVARPQAHGRRRGRRRRRPGHRASTTAAGAAAPAAAASPAAAARPAADLAQRHRLPAASGPAVATDAADADAVAAGQVAAAASPDSRAEGALRRLSRQALSRQAAGRQAAIRRRGGAAGEPWAEGEPTRPVGCRGAQPGQPAELPLRVRRAGRAPVQRRTRLATEVGDATRLGDALGDPARRPGPPTQAGGADPLVAGRAGAGRRRLRVLVAAQGRPALSADHPSSAAALAPDGSVPQHARSVP